MLNKLRTALSTTNNINRSAVLYNAIASGLTACQSIIILMFLNRIEGEAVAGIFSIAYANANLLIYVGRFGIRRYQASDKNEQFRISEYVGFRILTCILMLAMCLMYIAYSVLTKGYSTYKSLAFLFICLPFVIHAFSDVYEGNMQQKGRLDIGAKCVIVRTVLVIATYIVCLLLGTGLLWASAAATVVSAVSFVMTTINVGRDFGPLRPTFEASAMKGLFLAGLPIFIGLFLNNYIGMAPKYAIDVYMGDEAQAIYGFIFMPTFAIGMVCDFFFYPMIVRYTELWVDKQFRDFRALVFRQVGIILGITVASLAAAALIGIPVLSLIFGTDLTGYRPELCITILGGGCLALVTFFTTIITIMRKQNSMIYGYGIVALMALLLLGRAVRHYGMMGAVCGYTLLMFILMIYFAVFVSVNYRKNIKLLND